MVNVLSAEQMQQLDQFTIREEPISSQDLMERAASRLFRWVENTLIHSNKASHFSIFCGIGNNGGDGLVLAGKLIERKQQVKLFIVELSKNHSEDFQANLKKLPLEPIYLRENDHQFELPAETTIVDAIFGTGLSRPVEGFAAVVIRQLNHAEGLKLAVDMPSGLMAEDERELAREVIFQADHTLSFQCPKPVFFYPSAYPFVGKWTILPIGLHQQGFQQLKIKCHLLEANDIEERVTQRKPFSHKGTYGHALLGAGERGKFGAAVLSAGACLRSGAGLTSVLIDKEGEGYIHQHWPEAMIFKASKDNELKKEKLEEFDALGIGPGMGQGDASLKLLRSLITHYEKPMVLDADALNLLSNQPELISKLPEHSILTPHPGEFNRLAGEWKSDHQKLQLQRELAEKHQLVVVLKGYYTSIASPDGMLYFNPTGNPGMATGGSGDVLTGVLTALLTQGYDPLDAAMVGVYLHGLAGDLAACEYGETGLIASDIIHFLPRAFKQFEKTSKL
jgi:NAD(P)H-hydrate epimerase